MGLFQHVLDDESLSLKVNLGPAVAALFKRTDATVSIVETISDGALTYFVRPLVADSRFLGGVVCDHPSSFIHLAGMSATDYRRVINTPKDCALSLAQAFQAKTQATVTLATTGYMGKTPDQQDTIASVEVCFILGSVIKQKRFQATGSRNQVLSDISQHTLAYLKQYLSHYILERSHSYG